MTNNSGAIGTRTETAIVRHARANGFAGADEMTQAQRLRLNGAADQGDIGLCPGVVVGSKGGHMAEQASDAQIATWLAEVEAQRRNRGVDVAFLVTKRKGKGAANAGAWWAHMAGWLFVYLTCEQLGGVKIETGWAREQFCEPPAVRMTLAEALSLLRCAGYGDAPEPGCRLPVPQSHGERRNPLAACADAPNGSEGISGPREVSG